MAITFNKGLTKSRLRWLAVFSIVVLATTLYFVKTSRSASEPGTSHHSAAFSEPVIPVAIASSSQGEMPVYLQALGTVTPLQTVTVKSRVDGELTKVAFKEGQSVKAGDLLAEINPQAYKIQLMQAEGQLLRDNAILENAKVDLIRYKTLLNQDSIAAQQVTTQEWLVKQYQGTVAIDNSLVANAKLQLSYTRILAPISGRIGVRQVDQGNIVHTTDTGGIAIITQVKPISVVFTLPEDQVQAVLKRYHTNQRMAIELYDRGGENRLALGQLTSIDNQIDTTTGTVKLKGQFTNEDLLLFPNQFVNIKMHMDTLQAVTLVPTTAIQHGVMGTFVYVVNNDQTVSIRPIKVGPSEKDNVAVLNGIAADEKVVVDGADQLKDGIKVKAVPLAADPSALNSPPEPGTTSYPKSGK